ncbi:hypothetical protein FQN50_008580 [Emmonsiellopsis sp. PD_5]|nr:hypothetical protein FQN50_008580 [Emmonsiellopsis sp. PD_5]
MSTSSTNSTSAGVSRRFFRHRSKSPAPIDTSSTNPASTTNDNDTTGISSLPPLSFLHAGQRTNSPPPLASPTSPTATKTPTSPAIRKRHSQPPPNPRRKSSTDYKRLSGTVNHCGRHANDWLFGGFSVRESVGRLWRDDEDLEDEREEEREMMDERERRDVKGKGKEKEV